MYYKESVIQLIKWLCRNASQKYCKPGQRKHFTVMINTRLEHVSTDLDKFTGVQSLLNIY